MIETFIPKSSNISEITYDSDEQKLSVTFVSGSTWEYEGVPQATFLGLQNAQSAGSYFYRNVRSVYSGTEV